MRTAHDRFRERVTCESNWTLDVNVLNVRSTRRDRQKDGRRHWTWSTLIGEAVTVAGKSPDQVHERIYFVAPRPSHTLYASDIISININSYCSRFINVIHTNRGDRQHIYSKDGVRKIVPLRRVFGGGLAAQGPLKYFWLVRGGWCRWRFRSSNLFQKTWGSRVSEHSTSLRVRWVSCTQFPGPGR